MSVVLAALIGYAIGSIPFAFLVVRRRSGRDIRVLGSGNVGAANVQRSAGSGAALLTAFLDVAKGAVPVLIARAASWPVEACAVAGLAAIVGHVYPVWLNGRGGKGVATTLGACLVWTPGAAAVALVVFGLALLLSRMVSLGSVLAAVALGPLAWAMSASGPIVAALCTAGVLIVMRHRGNLLRIVAGTERCMGRVR